MSLLQKSIHIFHVKLNIGDINMSKKNGPMDLYFQYYNLTRILISRNLDDLIELVYEKTDSKLHLPENLELICNDYKNELLM